MTAQELEEIRAEMCDKFCRIPYSKDEVYIEEKCAECPLNRLEVENVTGSINDI
jgi:hypothetical protein